MRTRLPETESAIAADLAACTAMLRGGSRTFFAASHVLPRNVKEPATALYAFCRLADDAVDINRGKTAALVQLHERLERAYAGRPFPTPADRAFADVVERFAMPRILPEALLDGLAWDIEGRRYETISELKSYAVRVAGTVGAMMSILMGARAPHLVARACDLGVAMQLTNIARDVGEDAREGRLYLPLQWLRAGDVDPEAWLARPAFSEAIGVVVQRLLKEADILYAQSRLGIAGLPLSCRPGIHAARLLYAEIGREVERAGCDSVNRRAVVSGRRKLQLVARSMASVIYAGDSTSAVPLPEAQYLIDAIAVAPALRPVRIRRQVSRFIWLIGLFEQLERREHLSRSNS